MADPDTRWLLPLLLALVAGGLTWYFVFNGKLPSASAPATEPAGPATVAPAELPGPIHPMPEPAIDETAGELVALPSLDDSDAYFKLALVDVFGPGVDGLVAEQALIERFVTTIDNLPRGHVSEKIRPVGGLSQPFRAEPAGDDETYELNPANYARYDGIVATLVAADDAQIFDVYRRFYPLFQEAYVSLGFPNGFFNDRAVEVIDHLLGTPTPAEPIYLTRSNVLYEFADPDLEALSAGQKLLIRIGPGNAARVKARLKALRETIAAGTSTG